MIGIFSIKLKNNNGAIIASRVCEFGAILTRVSLANVVAGYRQTNKGRNLAPLPRKSAGIRAVRQVNAPRTAGLANRGPTYIV